LAHHWCHILLFHDQTALRTSNTMIS
jgi:hypothetical protein